MTHAYHSSSVRRTDQIQFHTPNHSQVRALHAGQFRNLLVDPRASLSFAPVRTHHLAETSATHAHHSSSVRRTDQIQFHTPNHSQVRASHAGFPTTYSLTRVRRSRLHHYGRLISQRRVQSTLTTLLACVALTKFSFTRPTTHRSERRTRVNFVTYSSTRVRRSRLHQYGRTISRRRVRRSLTTLLACVALTKFSFTFTAIRRSERRTRVSPQPTRRPACDALVCTSRTHHLAETSATHAHHSSSVRCTNQIQFHTSNHSQVRASHVGFPTTYSSPNQPSGGSNNLALIPARFDTVASSKQRSSRSFALKYVFRILNC